MTHHWDEFAKSLAEKSVPRRESLRLLGAALASALLAPLGLRNAAAAGADPCRAYCDQFPRWQRTQCRNSCRACYSGGGRYCGSSGYQTCCHSPYACCGNTCRDLASDVTNCGACGYECPGLDSGPDVGVACIDGTCQYAYCAPGTDYLWNSSNCGWCGNVCPWGTACSWGVCEGGGGGDGGF
jgi:hypothetical protein